jgi:hypothetical protein
VGFFLRVRPAAASLLTTAARSTFEGVRVDDPALPEFSGGWGKGAIIQVPEDVARSAATARTRIRTS